MFQKTLQYAGGKVDYAIREFMYILSSDTNLQIGKIENYYNKILISSYSFNIGTNLKVNLDDDKLIEKDDPEVKLNIKSKREDERDIKMIKTKLMLMKLLIRKKRQL